MKKVFLLILSVTITVCAFGLTACGHTHKYTDVVTAPTCTEQGYTTHTCECGDVITDTYVEALGHEFTNYVSNGDATCLEDGTKTATCDRDDCSVTDTVEDTDSALGHSFTNYVDNGDMTKTAVCDREDCEETDTKAIDGIIFKTLTVTDKTAYGKVSNTTETFDFNQEVLVSGSANYFVSTDISGLNVLKTRIATLQIGDNVFYVTKTVGSTVDVYTVTIRRKPMYKVTIYDRPNEVRYCQIEEDGLVPEAVNLSWVGYDFNGWDFDYNTPITGEITINALWTPKTNIPYKVEYYVENIEDNKYSLLADETEEFVGTTDTTVSAEIKDLPHFTPVSDSVSTSISGNGSTIIKVYYTRNKYNVNFDANGGALINGNATQVVKYGASAIEPTFTRYGYEFTGFDKSFNFIEEDVIITANWNICQYSITLVLDNGEDDIIITKDYDSVIGDIATPVKERYCFVGWYPELPVRMPGKDSVYTAQWERDEFEFADGVITGLSDIGKQSTEIVIPKTLWGKQVTEIAEGAFVGCEKLTKLVIPETIHTVGAKLFDENATLTVYLETHTRPAGWAFNWNNVGAKVVYKYGATDLGMLDYKKTTNFNVANRINDGKTYVSYSVYKLVGDASIPVECKFINTHYLSTTSLNEGYYKIIATATDGTTHRVFVDLYDSNAEKKWISTSSAEYLDYADALAGSSGTTLIYAYKDQSLTQKAVEIVTEKDIRWFKYSHTDNYPLYLTNDYRFNFSEDAGLVLKPIHSREYYEQLNTEGYEVVFNVMFKKDINEVNQSTMTNLICNNSGFKQIGNLESDTVYTIEGEHISLATLLVNWDYIQTDTSRGATYMTAFITNNADAHGGALDFDIYVSDVKIMKRVDVETKIYLESDGWYTLSETHTAKQWFKDTPDKVSAYLPDLDGYQLNTTLTGNTSKSLTAYESEKFSVYYRRIPVKDLGVKNISTNSTIDIDKALNSIPTVVYGAYSDYKLYNITSSGNVLVENAEIIDGVLSTAGLSGVYIVQAKDMDNNLYRVKFEAYNLDNPIWNDISLSNFSMYGDDGEKIEFSLDVVKIVNPNTDQEYDAIKIEKTDIKSMNWYVLNPLHSKAYYEMLAEEGYTLTYSVYFDAPIGSDTMNQFLGYGYQFGTTTNLNKGGTVALTKFNNDKCSVVAQNGWYTITADLSHVVDNWDAYTSGQWNGIWSSRNAYGFFHTYNPKADITMYVSGFELTKNN